MRAPIARITLVAALAAASLEAQTPPAAVSPPAAASTPTARPTPVPGTRISGVLECEKPERTSMEVGDMPGHAISIGKSPCRWTKPLTLGRLKTYGGETKAMRDQRGDRGQERGYHVGRTGAKGDMYYFRFDGVIRCREGVPEALQGRWAFTGGTGELEGLQGAGTYKGTFDKNGAATIEMEGEYRLKQPLAPGRTP